MDLSLRRPFPRSHRALTTLLLGLLFTLLVTACSARNNITASVSSITGQPVTGQYIYDQAHILTTTELADLEARAAAVERAGAPIIVYLQLADVSYDTTLQDARSLMDTWNVQSAPNARDGIVMFVNLKPNNQRHGEVALYAGQALVDSGKLPQRELQRIYADVMLPRLTAEHTADGIGAGLDAISQDLLQGPPPAPRPSRLAQVLATLLGVPLLVLSGLAIVALVLLGARRRRRQPTIAMAAYTTPPDQLPVATVGALVGGRVTDAQVIATLLDLARRGVLTIEPAEKHRPTLRIIERDPALTGFELSVFRSALDVADANGLVPLRDFGKMRARWGLSKDVLRQDLRQQGWYDAHAGARRTPLYLLATAALVISSVAFVAAAVTHTPLGFAGAVILFVVAVVAYGIGGSIPDTTEAGEERAAPWRGYLQTVRSQSHAALLGADLAALLDVAVPYALAAGAIGSLNRTLQAAGKQGYAPVWFGGAGDTSGDFYPIWTSFMGAASPSSSGAGDGGASSGGAGGGGAF